MSTLPATTYATEPVYYHTTNEVFDRFDPSLQGSKGSTNGNLGVWVGNERSECEMFGSVLMTLSIPEVVAYPLAYKKLVAMSDHAAEMEKPDAVRFYRTFASALLEEGYTVIDIIGHRGTHSHSILLDLESIVVEQHEALEPLTPSTWGR